MEKVAIIQEVKVDDGLLGEKVKELEQVLLLSADIEEGRNNSTLLFNQVSFTTQYTVSFLTCGTLPPGYWKNKKLELRGVLCNIFSAQAKKSAASKNAIEHKVIAYYVS